MEHQSLVPFSVPLEAKMFVLIGQHALADKMLELTATLCLRQRVTVLDCGNRSDMYAVARHIRPFSKDPVAAMNNIRLSRAFTGYQSLAMFEAVASARPSQGVVLVLDILPTFLDEDLKLKDACRLFKCSLACLSALSKHVPVVISAKPIPPVSFEREVLLSALRKQADFCWEEPLPLSATHPLQSSLFA